MYIFSRFVYTNIYMNAVFIRPTPGHFFLKSYILYIKSGIFKLQYLCAYLELDNVLGHYEIVLLEICWFPGSFLFFHNGRVPLSGAEHGGKLQNQKSWFSDFAKSVPGEWVWSLKVWLRLLRNRVGGLGEFPPRWLGSNFLNFQPILIKIELETDDEISSWFPACFSIFQKIGTP